MGIHEDAWQGTLVGDVLDDYIKNDLDIINQKDPVKGITPLAAATIRGHAEVVDELLKKGAKADERSSQGETPLLFAAWRTKKNRARIIQLLLAKTPSSSVDATCSHADNNTPLMFIIMETRPIDVESIRLLRKAGASLSRENDAHINAEAMAKKMESEAVLRALHPDTEWFDMEKLVDLIVSFLLFIISYVNNHAMNNVVNGVVQRMHKLNPVLDQNIDQAVNVIEPQSKEEFVTNIDNYVKDTPLERFFPKGSQFIHKLAEKVADLKDDPTTTLGSTTLLPKTIMVSMHQQVIYCDDSGSMAEEKRFDSLKELVKRITKTTTRILPEGEGVALRFINQTVPNATNLTFAQITDILRPMSQTDRGTKIGTNLRAKILEPLVYTKLATRPPSLERPLLVSVITDGEPTDQVQSAFVDAISECGDRLAAAKYPRESVKFLVSQIGTAKAAETFLKDLKKEDKISDVVFCTSDQLDAKFKEFKGNEGKMDRWLIETLFAPIKDRDD